MAVVAAAAVDRGDSVAGLAALLERRDREGVSLATDIKDLFSLLNVGLLA